MISLNRNLRYIIFGIVATAAFAGAYLWYHNTYQPLLAEVESVEQRSNRLEQRTQSARRSISKGVTPAEMAQRIQASNQQQMYVARLVPIDTATDDLRERLTAFAASNRVTLEGLSPVRQAVEGPYLTRGYSFRVKGTYHDVGAFLADALSMERITQLREPKLSAVRLSGEGENEEWGVEASLTLITFSTPSRPLAAPADSAAAAGATPGGPPAPGEQGATSPPSVPSPGAAPGGGPGN